MMEQGDKYFVAELRQELINHLGEERYKELVPIWDFMEKYQDEFQMEKYRGTIFIAEQLGCKPDFMPFAEYPKHGARIDELYESLKDKEYIDRNTTIDDFRILWGIKPPYMRQSEKMVDGMDCVLYMFLKRRVKWIKNLQLLRFFATEIKIDIATAGDLIVNGKGKCINMPKLNISRLTLDPDYDELKAMLDIYKN